MRAVTGAGSFPWEERRATGREISPEGRERLSESLAGILQRKADTYRPLVERLGIPFAIALYEDKDTTVAPVVCDLLYGRADPRDDSRAADGGAFGAPANGLAHVSAVLVFRRLDTPTGELLLRGELLENPRAAVPLAPATTPDRLRLYAADSAGRMRWRDAQPAFELDR